MSDREDVVLGAGLAGLTAAITLRHREAGGWRVLEREMRPGGHARSVRTGGYTFDLGPHILFTIDAEMEALIRSVLGDNIREQRREAFIYHAAYDRYTRFPFQGHLHGLPVEVVAECLVDLVRAVEQRAAGAFAPANYEEWMRGTFGDAIAERLMIPYARKIWTVEPSTMDFGWIGRRVPTPDVGRIVRGALTDDVAQIGATANFWYPWRGGIEELAIGLAERAGPVEYGRDLVGLDAERRVLRFADGEEIAYGRVVWTLPLARLPEWCSSLPPDIEGACRSLAYQGILNINLGIGRADLSPYHWVYFYEDGFPFHRLSFPASFSPHMVPPGKGSISTEVAFRPGEPPEHERAVEVTVAALRRARILEPDDVVELVHVEEIVPAYVIYDLRHRNAVETISAWLREHGIHAAGRFGEWGYLNMDHAMRSGRNAAEAILAA